VSSQFWPIAKEASEFSARTEHNDPKAIKNCMHTHSIQVAEQLETAPILEELSSQDAD